MNQVNICIFLYANYKINIYVIYFQKKDISRNENDTLKDILLSDNLLDSIMNEQSGNIKTEMEGMYYIIVNENNCLNKYQ